MSLAVTLLGSGLHRRAAAEPCVVAPVADPCAELPDHPPAGSWVEVERRDRIARRHGRGPFVTRICSWVVL